MKKNTISALSQKEAAIVARLSFEEKDIVTAQELDSFLPSDFTYRKQLVYTLKKKRILRPIKRGVYIFVPLESVPTGRRVSEFLIPPIFFPGDNYCIGYSTMFNYYGFTDQQFQIVYVLNTTRCMKKTIAGVSYKFVKIPSNRFYGLEKISIKNKEIIVSSKERTLIDLIYFNRPVGGIETAGEILRRFVMEKKCDVKKLIEYAVKFPGVKTRKVVGFNLEKVGISDSLLKPLEKSVKNTSFISISDSRKGTLNKRWKIIINDTQR
ncbi:type IV toxin-antitoxin system AbiEi family antitoxin [Candidatus Omnitrophota bacterium]